MTLLKLLRTYTIAIKDINMLNRYLKKPELLKKMELITVYRLVEYWEIDEACFFYELQATRYYTGEKRTKRKDNNRAWMSVSRGGKHWAIRTSEHFKIPIQKEIINKHYA